MRLECLCVYVWNPLDRSHAYVKESVFFLIFQIWYGYIKWHIHKFLSGLSKKKIREKLYLFTNWWREIIEEITIAEINLYISHKWSSHFLRVWFVCINSSKFFFVHFQSRVLTYCPENSTEHFYYAIYSYGNQFEEWNFQRFHPWSSLQCRWR